MRFFLFFLSISSFLCGSIKAVYLTLTDDSAHSMSIHWIEKGGGNLSRGVFYQKEGDREWKRETMVFPRTLADSSHYVKECLITGLEESSYYLFYFEGKKQKYLFKTLPSKLKRPLKIAVGGDFTESFPLFRKMNKVAAQKNPDFAILGGDIAYACRHGWFAEEHGSISKWIDFFKEWQSSMRGERGRLIPVVAIIGNHDVTSKDREEKGKNSLFLKFFPSSTNRTYKTVDVAGSLSLFLLDSGHLFKVEKEQKIWLEASLKEKQKMVWKIPIYHIAAYPSKYPLNDPRPTRVRTNWTPLFEKYGVKFAFEHHNHAFKRTYPMLDETIDPSGIVYIGDGSWGAPPRKVHKNLFYLEKSLKSSCFSLMTVDAHSLQVEVFNNKNELIDTWKPRGL
jgi:hypothetical protein